MATKTTVTRKVTKTIEEDQEVTLLELTQEERKFLSVLSGLNVTASRVLFGDEEVAMRLKRGGFTEERSKEILSALYWAL